MRVAIETDTTQKDKGYWLSIGVRKGSKDLALELTRDGERVGSAQVTARGETCPVSVERRGGNVVVLIDGAVAIQTVNGRS